MEALYQERILEHYRRPHGKGSLDDADATAIAHNSLCGEEIEVAVAVDRTASPSRLRDVRFVGQTCSISQASASMMTEVVRGRTADEIAALADCLARLLGGASRAADDRALGPLVALRAVSRVPARIPCALLPWEALTQALARAMDPAESAVDRPGGAPRALASHTDSGASRRRHRDLGRSSSP